jgi:hypothetical protein
MADGQDSQHNRSRHEDDTQRDPQPVDYSPDANNTLTEALTSRAHSSFSIGCTELLVTFATETTRQEAAYLVEPRRPSPSRRDRGYYLHVPITGQSDGPPLAECRSRSYRR